MIERETAYSDIENLVAKFKHMPAAQRKGLNEMETRLGYILPMFKALGWDITDIDEVSPETKVSRGWVDFSFRIDNIPRFFLETKRVKEDLNDKRWVSQAIDYAWTKSVTWALLSDFEGLRVFNAEWKESNPFTAEFFQLDLDSYTTNFDRLWWLSKPATLQRTLDLEAEKVGKKIKRLPVSQNLFRDLKRWREDLFKNYQAFNLGYSTAQIDEAVLRLLNRLIFIRTAEDRKVEDVLLLSLVRELKGTKEFNHLDRKLAALFRRLDQRYNSQLFARHFSEELVIPPTDLEEIIEGLYEKDLLFYNFNALDADVLGTVYEQYLGHVVAEREGESHVQEKRAKRKSQGIYYTPAFVTKYVVQQTVGRYLNENGYQPSKPLRVLDLACGSASFLTQAFDQIDSFVARQRGHDQKEELNSEDRARQLEILQNCIYGVDKDRQAVEVARLNLLLRALHSHAKMPMLDHIVNDDSLSPGIFESRFPDVMKEGGFDVIVGNPPYVRQETLGEEFKAYARQVFETYAGTADLYIYFIEQAHKLLKPGGYFGMIVSNKWMRSNYGKALREFLKCKSEILQIVDFGELPVFGDVIAYPVILIFRKNPAEHQTFTYAPITRLDFDSLSDEISSVGSALNESVLLNSGWSLSNANRQALFNKIQNRGEKLIDYVEGNIYFGIKTGFNEAFYIDRWKKDAILSEDTKYAELIKPILMGRNVHEYVIDFDGKWLIVIPKGWTRSKMHLKRPTERQAWKWFGENYPLLRNHLEEFQSKATKRQDKGEYWWELRTCEYYSEFEKTKIVAPTIVKQATFALDTESYYSNDKTTIIGSCDLYLLGIINSKISDFVFRSISSTKQGGYFEQKPMYISQLPIPRIDFENPTEKPVYDEIVSLVEKMLALRKERRSVRPEDDLDHARALDGQIRHVDREINLYVYRLYGLTVDEINLVDEGQELEQMSKP
jgi:type I restriction-modification system DNA methylase subunit